MPRELEAEDPLDPGLVHPTAGARVPGPPTAAGVRRLGVDVGRHDVRLDLVAVEAGGGARVIDRVEDREQLAGLVPVAEAGECEHRPDRSVRVLAAVLAHAGHVALDVARVDLGVDRTGA